tara:strand:+ start:705 stop:869 length:165 start_codon:yes stop_codon:yes gene_type:complete
MDHIIVKSIFELVILTGARFSIFSSEPLGLLMNKGDWIPIQFDFVLINYKILLC